MPYGRYELHYRESSGSRCEVSTTVITPLTDEVASFLDSLVIERGSATQSLTETEFDATNSFSVTLTVYAEGITSGYLAYYKVTDVSISINGANGTSGSYVGSGVYIVSQSSTASSDGKSYTTGGMVTQNVLKTKAANIRNWSYSTPLS